MSAAALHATVAPATAPEGVGSWRRLISAVVVTVAAMTPVFTTSAQAGAIETGLRLSPGVFGATLTCFFGATAIASIGTRRLATRIPVPVALVVISVVATACLAGLASSHHAWQLMVLLAVAGCGNALTQPIAARIISSDVAANRLSLAAGLVGAALGAAPFVPGLLVGTVGVPHGWRSALWVAAVLTAATVLLAPLTRQRNPATTAATRAAPAAAPAGRATRIAVAWTLAAAIGSVGTSVCANYFVQIGTTSGLRTSLAGTLLTVASVLAVAVRLGSGALADRAPGRNPTVVAAMMTIGAVGLAVTTLHTPVAFAIGALLAVAGGWGWTGLLLAATMRLLPGQAARAGAIMQGGLFAGTATAPLAFGVVSSAVGVPTSVGIASLTCLVAAGLTTYGALLLRRDAAPW